jgi:transposase
VEIYTGGGRRRRFTTAEKLDLVAQMDGCDNISELARRNALRPSQLFTWRRELRYAAETVQAGIAMAEPMFVPAVVEPVRELAPAIQKQSKPRRRRGTSTAVELDIGGVAVKIARGADASVIAAVIDALKTRS